MAKDSVALQAEYFQKVRYRAPSDPVIGAYADPKIEFIRRHVPLQGNILDVGCGNGIFTSRLAKDGASVVGLDLSGFLLQQNPHAGLIHGDASKLPFEDRSFDVVFEANLLHHVPRRESVIMEMSRVSRRYVVLLEPNRYNPLMAALSIVVPAERGGLKSCLSRLTAEVGRCGMNVVASIVTGMISQNNTPAVLVPWLRRFDRPVAWGEYIIVIAEKRELGV